MNLTAPHSAYDLKLVAVAERCLLKQAARHDLAVALDGKAFPLQPKPCDELVYRQLRLFEVARIAVDGKLNQSRNINWKRPILL
jgi:hypothetical protein